MSDQTTTHYVYSTMDSMISINMNLKFNWILWSLWIQPAGNKIITKNRGRVPKSSVYQGIFWACKKKKGEKKYYLKPLFLDRGNRFKDLSQGDTAAENLIIHLRTLKESLRIFPSYTFNY
jgi:hypothetical protein